MDPITYQGHIPKVRLDYNHYTDAQDEIYVWSSFWKLEQYLMIWGLISMYIDSSQI